MPDLPPSSAVRLAVRAYRAIEHDGVMTSFDDGTEEAQDAALHFDAARRETLQAVDWRFASKVFQAATRTDIPEIDSFIPAALDKSVIRVREVPGRNIKWRVEGRLLYVNQTGPVTYRATIDAQDPTEYTPSFESALVFMLAHYLAPRWTTSANRARMMLDNWNQTVQAANGDEAREASPTEWVHEEQSDWAEAMAFGGGRVR